MEVYKRLLRYTRSHRRDIVISLVCSVIVGATTGVSALIVKNVVDDIFMHQDQAMLMSIPFIVLALVAIKGLASFGQEYYIERVGQQIILQIRAELFRHLQALSLGFFAKHQSGTLVSRIMNDVMLLQTAAAALVSDSIRQAFSAAGLLAVVFYRHWRLALMAMLVLPVAMGIVTYFGRRLSKISHVLQQKMADL